MITLEEAVNRPWVRHIVSLPPNDHDEAGFLCTVDGLDDFEMYAPTKEELEHEWKDMITSHLMAYIAIGKEIPNP